MTIDEPRRIGSDIDLFDDHPPTPAAIPEPDVDKANLVLGMLRGAALAPPYAMDQDESEVIWASKIAAFDTMILHDAANDWIDNNTKFPTVSDFVSVCLRLRNRARAIKQANDNPVPGTVCIQCGGLEFIDDDEDAVIATGHPCPSCVPERYKLWSGGHFMKAHQEMGGCGECKNR